METITQETFTVEQIKALYDQVLTLTKVVHTNHVLGFTYYVTSHKSNKSNKKKILEKFP